jgi:hypothetical protein
VSRTAKALLETAAACAIATGVCAAALFACARTARPARAESATLDLFARAIWEANEACATQGRILVDEGRRPDALRLLDRCTAIAKESRAAIAAAESSLDDGLACVAAQTLRGLAELEAEGVGMPPSVHRAMRVALPLAEGGCR